MAAGGPDRCAIGDDEGHGKQWAAILHSRSTDSPIGTAGSQGLRATMAVTNFSRNEPLEEALTVSVTVKPTYSANPPEWMIVP